MVACLGKPAFLSIGFQAILLTHASYAQATHSRQGRTLLPCEIIELAEKTMESTSWQQNCHSQYRKTTMAFLENKIVKTMADYREFLGLERGDAPENLEHGDALDIGAERKSAG
jgi:hypothetical protein